MSDRDGDDRPVASRSYLFAVGPPPERPREAMALWKIDATAALRAAQGLGAGFELRIASGRESRVELRVEDGLASRWAERVLFTAYRPREWRAIAAGPSPDLGPTWVARRTFPSPEPAAASSDLPSFLAPVTAGLSTLRPGVRVDLAFRPSSLQSGAGWLRELAAAIERPGVFPAGTVRPHLGRAPSSGPIAPMLPAPAPLWLARIELRAGEVEQGRLARRLVESAWNIRGMGGIRFRRPRLPQFGLGNVSLSEGEVVALLPTWEARTVRGPEGPVSGTMPIGRTPDGAPVGLPVEAVQGRHLAVLGETGMGKSSLLVALARRAAQRGGVILLDPLGETAAAMRAEFVRDGRRVRFLEPGAEAVGLNALAGLDRSVDETRVARRVDDIVHALRRVRSSRYADTGFWGPRLEEMLGRSLRAAAAEPGGTLEDAWTYLGHRADGPRRIPPGCGPELHELLGRVRERPDDAEGARRLLYEVVRSPVLREMLSSRAPDLVPADLVGPGEIVLISGAAHRVGASAARYLLALYLALLWSEILARSGSGKLFVILDEAQWFAHESLAEMLRLGRRCNAHVILATQSLASLPEAVHEAASTNVADVVAFRGSPGDAREMGRLLPGVTPDQLLALPRGAAVALIGKGERIRWVRTARVPSGPDGPTPGPAAPRSNERGGAAHPAAGVREGPLTERFLEVGRSHLPERPGRPPIDLVEAQLREGAERARGAASFPLAIGAPFLGFDPRATAAAWRAVGSQLGRRGAILRTVGPEGGRVWTLATEPVRRYLAEQPPRSLRGEGSAAPDSPELDRGEAAAERRLGELGEGGSGGR